MDYMVCSPEWEAVEYNITATKEEIDMEMEKFSVRLRYCIERYGLEEIPIRIKTLDDVRSELTMFNYNNLHYFK